MHSRGSFLSESYITHTSHFPCFWFSESVFYTIIIIDHTMHGREKKKLRTKVQTAKEIREYISKLFIYDKSYPTFSTHKTKPNGFIILKLNKVWRASTELKDNSSLHSGIISTLSPYWKQDGWNFPSDHKQGKNLEQLIPSSKWNQLQTSLVHQ